MNSPRSPRERDIGDGSSVVKTLVIKRSIFINGHKTSVSLEEEFWGGLHEIADREKLTRSDLIQRIADRRDSDNLSSSIRVFVINHFRKRRITDFAPSHE